MLQRVLSVSGSKPKNRIRGSNIFRSTQFAPKFYGFLGKNFAVHKFLYHSISVLTMFKKATNKLC